MNKKAFNYYLKSVKLLINKIGIKNIFISLMNPNKALSVEDFKFYFRDAMDLWTLKEVIIDDVYQAKKTLSNNKKFLTVIDIGASIGDFDVFCDKLIKKGKVIAYEPDKNRVNLARRNFNLNQTQKVMLVTNFARSLDEIFKTHNLKKCDLLKIDCEGGEYPILLSSPISLAKVNNLSMEVHLFDETMQDNFKKLKRLLKKLGFKIKIEKNPVHEKICYLFAQK